MNIIESILTENPCYTSNKKITVKGFMLHSVGCLQPDAKVFVKNWNSKNCKTKCVHGFIDGLNDGTVYQTLPWNHRGWHCGKGVKGSANNTHIGVEMCEPKSIKYTTGANFTVTDLADAKKVAIRTYNTAVELCAKLCKDYSLDPTKSGVIISHKEGHKLGLASNHGDPEHLWNGLGLPFSMDTFRRDVKFKMENKSEKEETKSDVTSFKVKVTISNLRVRSGAGINYSSVGTIKAGVYTIVENKKGSGSKKGWGKLKSGAGWISLDYAENV